MKTVHKIPLRPKEEHEFELEFESHYILQTLSVQVQDGVPCLWVMVNTAMPKETTKIHIVGTGWEIPDGDLRYQGTYQLGDFVWHVFMECS